MLDTLCAYRNDRGLSRADDIFDDLEEDVGDHQRLWLVLLDLIDRADCSMGDYEPIYRKWLSGLRYRVHNYDKRDHTLIKSLSKFVGELNILLEPLQAQIDIILQWHEWYKEAHGGRLDAYLKSLEKRKAHLDSMKRLQSRARESQDLVRALDGFLHVPLTLDPLI